MLHFGKLTVYDVGLPILWVDRFLGDSQGIQSEHLICQGREFQDILLHLAWSGPSQEAMQKNTDMANVPDI
jgi:hypothetical protein